MDNIKDQESKKTAVHLKYIEDVPDTTDLNQNVYYLPSAESPSHEWISLGYIEERGYKEDRTYTAFNSEFEQVTPTSNNSEDAIRYFQNAGYEIQRQEKEKQLNSIRQKQDQDKDIER